MGSILVCQQVSIDSIIVGQQGSMGSILVGSMPLYVASLCASRGL